MPFSPISEEIRAPPPPLCVGMRYGFTHYTVVLLGCRDCDGNFYIVDEHAERNWLAGASPTNTELELSTNWLRVWENKNIRIVAVTHNN